MDLSLMDSPAAEAATAMAATPVRRAPRQSRSRRLVEMALTACAELITERGLAALSTNAVAERAGVSVGAIYQYFPDKAALVAALRARHLQAMLKAVAARWDAVAPANLAEAVQALVAGQFEAHAIAPVLHAELLALGPFFVVADARLSGDEAQAPGLLWLRWRRLLAAHRDQLALGDTERGLDLDLAAWVALLTVNGLAQGAALPFARQALQAAAEQAVWAYLKGAAPLSGCP
jgi:AcrR family transcriptional regulator